MWPGVTGRDPSGIGCERCGFARGCLFAMKVRFAVLLFIASFAIAAGCAKGITESDFSEDDDDGTGGAGAGTTTTTTTGDPVCGDLFCGPHRVV